MRTIKFRAWDESQKYMAIQGTPDLETIQSFFFHFGGCQLMQFTGSTDKNSVEIYEGDILKTNEADWVGKVEFKHSAYIISDDNGGYSTYPDFSKCEVVGNIFNNPELL